MSDVVESGSTTATEVPAESPSPANDPAPAETPAMSEPVVEPAQPQETPVIHTPTEMPPEKSQVTDKSSERFSATPSPSPELSPTLRQGPTPVSLSIKDRLADALAALSGKKRKRLDKILQLAATKKSIKNDDVEKLLRVSDSTAQRYLKQLVQEGKLTVTQKGNDAWYEPR